MKILVITNHFEPENFRINQLAFGLAEKGHDVSVLTGLPNYPEGKVFSGYGVFKRRFETIRDVKVKRIPLIPRGNGRALRLAINYLSSAFFFCTLGPFYYREKYDVIFVFSSSPTTIGLPAVVFKWFRKIPVVFWVLDLWPESLSATGAVTNSTALSMVGRVVRLIYRNCDEILISSMGFEDSVRKTGDYNGPVTYFPNWVEPIEPDVGEIELPELPDGFKIVFTGNIGTAQDFETIVDAANKLRDRDIHWVIVGHGRNFDWVQKEVLLRNLEDKFHLLGRFPVGAMPYFWSNADALLLPLKKDPIFALTAPGKLQNYLYSGRPIIASIDGESATLVEKANAGVVSPAQDPDKLAAAVLRLYEMDPAERNKLGDNGREFALDNFDRSKLFDQLEKCLLEVVNKNESKK